jgi:type II secretory pathway pseudopilin PulG
MWSAGNRNKHSGAGEHGITLVEAMIVVGVIALLAGVVFPAVSSGIDSIRLAGAADSVAGFLSGALNRAERRQQPVVISISAPQRTLVLESVEAGFTRKLELPEGIRIAAVLPAPPTEVEGPRRFLVLPGGIVPRIGIELSNGRGGRRMVRVDPITGVPKIERPAETK